MAYTERAASALEAAAPGWDNQMIRVLRVVRYSRGGDGGGLSGVTTP
jgi:hypothetical protein